LLLLFGLPDLGRCDMPLSLVVDLFLAGLPFKELRAKILEKRCTCLSLIPPHDAIPQILVQVRVLYEANRTIA
jgi:hypothetical protein